MTPRDRLPRYPNQRDRDNVAAVLAGCAWGSLVLVALALLALLHAALSK